MYTVIPNFKHKRVPARYPEAPLTSLSRSFHQFPKIEKLLTNNVLKLFYVFQGSCNSTGTLQSERPRDK